MFHVKNILGNVVCHSSLFGCQQLATGSSLSNIDPQIKKGNLVAV
jgi:hypothetical protein